MVTMPPPCTRETPRCEFWAWERDFVRPPCCTAHLKELLFFADDLLTRHNIFHWLDYGSLLGAVRSQDLIPWDLDGDFCGWFDDADKILALEPEIRAAGFWLDTERAPHILRILYSRVNLLHVDLFLCGVENNQVKLGYIPDSEEWTFPLEYVNHLAPVTLCGKPFLAPSPLDSFLSQYRYGPDYMTPQQQPAMYDWSHVPSLKSERDTPLLQTLLREIREYDFQLASVAPVPQAQSETVTTAPPQLSLAVKLGRLIPYPARKILWTVLAYPFALRYWRAQKKSAPFALRELSPTIALLILEIERRKRLLNRLQKKARRI